MTKKEFAKKSPIPNFGDLLTIEDFIRDCKNESLIDYDGYGNFSDEEFIYEYVSPSDTKKKNFNPKNYQFVVWYNR